MVGDAPAGVRRRRHSAVAARPHRLRSPRARRGFCFRLFFGAEVRRRDLLKRGTQGWATILEVRETGMTVNENYPIAKLRLQVEPTDGEPYEVTTKCLMNRFDIPSYQQGNRVAVVIDPNDRTKVAVA